MPTGLTRLIPSHFNEGSLTERRVQAPPSLNSETD